MNDKFVSFGNCVSVVVFAFLPAVLSLPQIRWIIADRL